MTASTREPIGVEAEDLLAAIVGANVRNLAATTDALYDNMRQQRDDAHAAFAALYDRLAVIPEDVRSVTLERLLWRHGDFRDRIDRVREDDEKEDRT